MLLLIRISGMRLDLSQQPAGDLRKVNAVQVVHHPTIMAAYAQGRKWHVIGDGELRSKFLGPSIQLRPVGIMQLTFHDGDEYSWHKVRPRTCKALAPRESANFSRLELCAMPRNYLSYDQC